MKKLFWLIKKEIKSVYKLLILITIIITLFLSALNGVVNILIDYSKNFENSLNEDLKGLSFSVNETDFDSFKKYCDDAVVFATLKNFTSSATLTCSNGNIFETEQSKQEGDVTVLYLFNGKIVYNSYKLKDLYEKSNIGLQGRWNENVDEIMLSTFVARELQAQVGDKITISNRAFSVCGIYDFDLINDTEELVNIGYYMISVPDNIVADYIEVQFDKSYDTYKVYNKLKHKGFDVSIFFAYETYFENVRLMEMVLSIFSVIIFIAIIIVIYSFVSILLMSRNKYICQLKLLGLTEKEVFAVYFLIVLFMLIIATIFATIIGYFFNSYIMTLCAKLFDMKIKATLNIYLPFVFLVLTAIVTIIAYFLNIRKSKNKMVAQMIKEQL